MTIRLEKRPTPEGPRWFIVATSAGDLQPPAEPFPTREAAREALRVFKAPPVVPDLPRTGHSVRSHPLPQSPGLRVLTKVLLGHCEVALLTYPAALSDAL